MEDPYVMHNGNIIVLTTSEPFSGTFRKRATRRFMIPSWGGIT